ncbi:MAG TPA: SDR family oxidoreductase [Bryobacteraceae bacterium]|jgi:NAD(P)H dehydrogenase (quinone)|nr:SDR family oxidoreductase [Bryobacteraceae bacterium]
MTSDRTLFVTGASGQLGRRVLELLLEKGTDKIVAGTRKPEKLADLAARGVTVRHADFENAKELEAALAGVDRVLIISTDAIDRPGRRLTQHKAAVAAAASAGVKHAVYTSMPNPETSPVVFAPDHLGTEQALAASGMSYTILRNCWYTEFLIPTLAPAVASGKLIAATGQGGSPYVTREDCAQAAAAALASTDASNKTWNITGPTLVTYAELAKLTSELTGRAVTFESVTPEERTAQLIALGTPEFIAKLLVSTQMAIAQGKMGTPTSVVKELTGREPISVRDFLSTRREALMPATQTAAG